MQSASHRRLSGSALLRAGAGGAALVALLAAAPSCQDGSNPGQGQGDGGTRDMAGTSTDLLPSGALTLDNILPATGLAAGGNTVTLYGTGFAAGTTVTFGTTPATGVQVLSLTQLTAVVPASGGVLGPVAVTVRNPDGSSIARGDLYSYNRIQLSFAARISGPVGTNPVGLVASDINGDGFIEIVTANQTTNNVTLLAYNQAWKNGVSFPAATSPTALVAADFNGNGRPDLAVACSNATGTDLVVLADNGIGFLAPAPLTVAMNLVGVDARDLNADNKPDLVAISRSTGQAYVLLNSTTGLMPTFTAGASYALGSQPAAVLLNDMDGDGKPDLVGTSYAGSSLSVLLGQGAGVFGAAKPATTATQPIALALGDLNKDGRLDAVTTSFDGKQVSLLTGKGDGTFASLRNMPVGSMPRALAIADLDADGKQDLVVANSGDDVVQVFLGKGDGTFEPAQNFTVGSQPVGLVVIDLNKDGKLDIATANFNSNDISVLYNQT